ncbi:MAG TPA: hypothetical protein VGK67_30575 [Myxococcales bacterium]|jgi:hypothetical protein
MSSKNERLVLKGRWEPAAGLAQQAEYSLALWAEFKKDMVSYGFPEEKADQMREVLRQVTKNAAEGERWEKRRDVALAINGSKAFIFRLRRVAPMVLRDRGLSEPTTADFFPGQVERSAPRIIEYLQRIRPYVKRLEASLRPYFRGESPVLLLDAVLTSLESVRGQQELAGSQLEDSSASHDEAKGELLHLVEDLNRVGAIAFHGRADVIGRFNKDLLLRARRSKTGKAEPEPSVR